MLKTFKAYMIGIGVIFIMILGCSTVSADPICPVPVEVTQPNGNTITVTSYGDEFFSWQEDENGNVVTYDEESNSYKYAEVTDGKIVSTSQTVGEVSLFSIFSHKIQREDIIPLWESAERIDYSKLDEDNDIKLMSADETRGTVETKKLLTILIDLSDIQITMGSEFWNKEMFDTTPGALSVVNYWKENSNGLAIFEPADTSGVNIGRTGTVSHEDYTDIAYKIIERTDGVVRVSLNIPHPTPTGSEDFWDNEYDKLMYAAQLAFKAVEADFDFAAEQPHIVTVFAGYEQIINQGTANKGHIRGFATPIGMETIDGINLGSFTVQAEMYSLDVPAGIGTICHELGHSVFNLPDLYLNSNSEDGLYMYSLMASGSFGHRYDETDGDKKNDYGNPYATYSGHVPTHLDPWCKIKCGFITPTLVNEWDGKIHSVSDGGDGSKYNVIKVQSKADPKQYFLIENRQLVGFDKGLEVLNGRGYSHDTSFNGGILIYHIDENVDYNNNNSTKMHRFISAEQSNRATPTIYCAFEWQYLNIDGRNLLNEETIPNSNFYETDNLKLCSTSEECHPQTVKSGISIEVLDESNSSMQVKVNVDDEYRIENTNETFLDVFKDANFCNAIIEMLSEDEKERQANDIISADDWFKILSIESLTISDRNIRSLKGIEHLSKLIDITCCNNELTELDFSDNHELNYIDCKNNKLSELNVSGCKNLMFLYCSNNSLKKLNIQSNNELMHLNCSGNELTEINVNGNPKLNRFVCYDNYMDENPENSIIGLENNIDQLGEASSKDSKKKFIYYPQRVLPTTPFTVTYYADNITVTNNSDETVTVAVIIANYDSNGVLQTVTSDNIDFTANETKHYDTDSNTKIFVWNSLSGMRPLTAKE